MMTRATLAIFALLFVAFGLWSLIDPVGMTGRLGVEVSGPSGIFEMRGIFGGVNLGFAGLMAAGALRSDMIRPALWGMVAYFGGYMIGRAASFIAGDSAATSSWGFAGFELFGLLVAVLLLRKQAK